MDDMFGTEGKCDGRDLITLQGFLKAIRARDFPLTQNDVIALDEDHISMVRAVYGDGSEPLLASLACPPKGIMSSVPYLDSRDFVKVPFKDQPYEVGIGACYDGEEGKSKTFMEFRGDDGDVIRLGSRKIESSDHHRGIPTVMNPIEDTPFILDISHIRNALGRGGYDNAVLYTDEKGMLHMRLTNKPFDNGIDVSLMTKVPHNVLSIYDPSFLYDIVSAFEEGVVEARVGMNSVIQFRRKTRSMTIEVYLAPRFIEELNAKGVKAW